nr:isoflavone 3'-hydroxylase-like [Tanacetum cinerariifolium]GFA38075.1 isoflavone 3'-hydroxylase-like [Tanacetum cinerariifolium]
MDTLYVILSIIAIIRMTKNALRKERNQPPSSFPCVPIIGHLYLIKSPLYRALGKLSKRHGPVLMLRFGTRRALLVSSPAVVEECLTTNDVAFANRPHLLAGKHLGRGTPLGQEGVPKGRYYGDSVAEVEEARWFKEIVEDTFVLMETTNVLFAVVEVDRREIVGEENGVFERKKKWIYARFVR